jgi:hypothetical protein
MRICLRTIPAITVGTESRVTESGSDLFLDIGDDEVFEADTTITGVIAEANGGNADAYVALRYPTLEFPGPGGLDFGASIVGPKTGVPGSFKVGTGITIKVTG